MGNDVEINNNEVKQVSYLDYFSLYMLVLSGWFYTQAYTTNQITQINTKQAITKQLD